MRLRHLLATAVLALGAALSPASAAFDRLYVFGDSLVDSGNAATQVPGSAPPSGRFTNGLNFADDLSLALGFGVATAYLQGGTNYSVGGATLAPWSQQTSPDVGTQITGYYTPSTTSADPLLARPAIDANSLVLLVAGGNDVRDYAKYGEPSPTATVTALQNNLALLIAGGARNIIVVGLPDIGLIPSVVNTPLAGTATQLSQGLNAAFGQTIGGFQRQFGAALSLQLFSLYALQQDLTKNAAAYGLDPALLKTGCVDGGGLASNCAGYAYYDGIHPTAQVHAIIGQQLAALVPEPATWALMVIGFGFTGAALRRTRREVATA